MIPFTTKDTHRPDRLLWVFAELTYSPYWLAFWNHDQTFHGVE